jgi:hypothetical protein
LNFYQSHQPIGYSSHTRSHTSSITTSSGSITDTIGQRYQMFSNLCVEKLKVFREYILTSDTLWMDPAVVTTVSRTGIIATRIDLLLDFLSVYCHSISLSSCSSISSSSSSLVINETLFSLLPNAIFAAILSSLRILIFLLGYALEDVIGTSSDTEIDCFTNCLNLMLIGFSTIDSICEATTVATVTVTTPRDIVNNTFINSWKSFQKLSLSLILEKEIKAMKISETIAMVCHEVPVLVSQVCSQKSLNLSISMKDEIFRLIGLLEEKISQHSFVGLVRSPSLGSPELLERCNQTFLRS